MAKKKEEKKEKASKPEKVDHGNVKCGGGLDGKLDCVK